MATMCEGCRSEYEMEAHPQFESEFEDEGELELEDELEDESELEGEGWLGAIGNVVGSLLGEQEVEGEFEGEDEFEDEFEGELNPIRKVYSDAMMEHLGALAAEAESEEEAVEHFLPLIGMAASKLLPIAARALAPMAKRMLPRVAKAVMRVAPRLTRGVAQIARGLHRRPGGRPLLRAVPAIARRTVHTIAKQAARGRTVTPRTAVRTLAQQTRRVLGHPARRTQALRRHNHVERRFHKTVGRGIVRPHLRTRRGGGSWVNGRWMSGRWINGRWVGAPSVSTPRVMRTSGVAGPSYAGAPYRVAGARPVGRTGRYVGGQCVCPACPTCGSAVAPTGAVMAAPAPAYCRCCGQVLR